MPEKRGAVEHLRELSGSAAGQLLVGLIVVLAVFSLLYPEFASQQNGENMARQGAILLVVAIGQMAVVLVGTHGYLKHIKTPDNAYQLFDLGIPAMLSLATIAHAQLHVGGETGLTLWAGVFGVPVVAAYGRWGQHRDKARKLADFRPIPFSKPVIYAPLNGSVAALVQAAASTIGAPPPVIPHVQGQPPSVAAVSPPPKRIVRAPRTRTPIRSPRRPTKTLKQLLAERRARA